MEIILANIEDSQQILSLQKLAYQSEAEIYQDYSIPPLTQTIEEIMEEFKTMVFLKAINGKEIVGSVRAYSHSDSCFIGRLFVHPQWQGKGLGTRLMNSLEACFSNVQRYELFTGSKSLDNIRLYKKMGYRPFREQAVNEVLSLIYMEKFGINST